jgi:hypothetical protein
VVPDANVAFGSNLVREDRSKIAWLAAEGGSMSMSSMRWQDWTNIALGVWLLVSPWVLGFSNIEAATWNAVLLGIAIVVLEFADVLVPDPWPERVSLPVGLWVIVSPMVLGFTDDVAATLSTGFTGLLVAAMSASAIWAERRKTMSRL